MYNSLRLSPWFYIIRLKNYSFIMTIQQFMKSPFSLLISNLHGLIPPLVQYLTIPVTSVIIIGLILGLLKEI